MNYAVVLDIENRHWDVTPHHPDPGASTSLGFWIFLMSDCLMFGVLFAVFGVLGQNYAAGPDAAALFDLNLIAANTAFLLFSSLTFGLAMIAMARNQQAPMIGWLVLTLLLGLSFLALELYEFNHLIQVGAGPHRSGFLSSFFALVGMHGLHVFFGAIWLVTMIAQVAKHGLIEANQRRLACLSMFWHFLDLIWIGVFSFVYLMGAY